MIDHRRVTSGDGTSIAYRLHGAAGKPWLVLSNGAGCSEEFWTAAFVPALADRFRIVEWNYRGFYDSALPSDSMRYRVEDHAADLCAILDAEGIRSAVFLGFSLGVQVTLETWRRVPDRFRGIAIVSGSFEDPLASFGGTRRLRPLLVALLDFGATVPNFTRRLVRLVMGGPLAAPLAKLNRFCENDVPDAPFRAYLHKASSLDPVAYMRTLRLMGEHSARDVLASIHVPVLLVAGTEDAMTPVWIMERMRDEIPGAEYVVAEGGRHTLLMTRGDWIAGMVGAFSERCP